MTRNVAKRSFVAGYAKHSASKAWILDTAVKSALEYWDFVTHTLACYQVGVARRPADRVRGCQDNPRSFRLDYEAGE